MITSLDCAGVDNLTAYIGTRDWSTYALITDTKYNKSLVNLTESFVSNFLANLECHICRQKNNSKLGSEN